MNLFRSEGHARRWPAFQARAAEGFITLVELAGFFGTETRRHMLDADTCRRGIHGARRSGARTWNRSGRRRRSGLGRPTPDEDLMRIVAIEPVLVDVPLATPVRGVHGTTALQRSLLVRVTTDAGVEGWGNVDPTPGYSLVAAVDVHDVVARLAPALVGADPFNLHRALALMDGEVADGFEAKAAIEMALLDVKGRALGLP